MVEVIGTILFDYERNALDFLEAKYPNAEFYIKNSKKSNPQLSIVLKISNKTMFYDGMFFDSFTQIIETLEKEECGG